MQKIDFALEIVDKSTPLNQDNFYKFLQSLPIDESRGRYTDLVTRYLATLDFDMSIHKLKASDLDTLKHVYEIYQYNWMPVRKPFQFYDLFGEGWDGQNPNPSLKDTELLTGFCVIGKKGLFKIKPPLYELLQERGLVYPLNPFNFCFEIINDRLWLKYQYIIGQRLVCNLHPAV